MKKFLLTLVLFVGMIAASYSQSAVYFCTVTGAHGVCYNSNDSYNCAYNVCRSFGGVSPMLVTSTNFSGYGVIATGYNVYGAKVIGVSLGKSYLNIAQVEAKNACYTAGAIWTTIQTYYFFDAY